MLQIEEFEYRRVEDLTMMEMYVEQDGVTIRFKNGVPAKKKPGVTYTDEDIADFVNSNFMPHYEEALRNAFGASRYTHEYFDSVLKYYKWKP